MAILFVCLLRSLGSRHHFFWISLFLSSWNGVRFSDIIFSCTYSVFLYFLFLFMVFFWDVGYLVWVSSLERSVLEGAQHNKLQGIQSLLPVKQAEGQQAQGIKKALTVLSKVLWLQRTPESSRFVSSPWIMRWKLKSHLCLPSGSSIWRSHRVCLCCFYPLWSLLSTISWLPIEWTWFHWDIARRSWDRIERCDHDISGNWN